MGLGIARADYVQAGLLENPTLGLSFLFPAGGGQTRVAADLAQSIMEIWRLSERRRAATAGMDKGRDLLEDLRYQEYPEHAEAAPIQDVIENVANMAEEFAAAKDIGVKIPCLSFEGEGITPLAISGSFRSRGYPFEDMGLPFDIILPLGMWTRIGPHYYRDVSQKLSRFYEQVGDIRTVGILDTIETVESSLASFLSYRFEGFKRRESDPHSTGTPYTPDSKAPPGSGVPVDAPWPPPPPGDPGGGLKVQVSCNTTGLRIHASPAYFITWTYFGSPSSPVVGNLLPGRYIYAGDGSPLQSFTPDDGVLSIPPTYSPALARF